VGLGWDAKDAIEAVQQFASNYFTWASEVLTKPSGVVLNSSSPSTIFVHLLISALVGGTLGAIIPGRPPVSDRATTAVVVVVLWIFTSLFMHFACRIMRGKGTVNQTILSVIQLLAVAYVCSTFLALLVTSARAAYPFMQHYFENTFVDSPGGILLFFQFLIMAVYTPIILKSVHRFQGVIVGSFTGLLCAVLGAFLAFPFIASGKC
jgi:hypothetical protein